MTINNSLEEGRRENRRIPRLEVRALGPILSSLVFREVLGVSKEGGGSEPDRGEL